MHISRRSVIRRLPLALAAPVALRARAATPPGTLDIHRATRNTWLGALGQVLPDLQSPPPPFKAYPGHERLPLPDGEPAARSFVEALTPAPDGPSDEELTLADIARLLRLANGVTGRLSRGDGTLHLRAAPSAGALYADELYLVCERIEGLPAGVYYYHVIEDALVPIRSGSPASTMVQALGGQPEAPAWLVVTSVFERYRFRYRNRGYRYALVDAGHIGENFTLAARAARRPVQRIDRFDDSRIGALLGIDGVEEAVCAVHRLGPALEDGGAGTGVPLEPAAEPLPTVDDVVERYHTATRLVADAAGAGTGTPREPRTDAPIAIEPREPEATLDAVIRERRSTREFRDPPLTAAALDYLARSAGAPLVHAPALSLHVIVHRVEGVRSGHYRYDTHSHSLTLIEAGDLRDRLRAACLRQRKASEAAVAFLPVADLPAAVERDGERAYRNLLLDAGAAGQRIYLAAEAAGRTARNLAAFIDDELNDLLDLDGRRHAVVHLTLAGRGD